MASYTGDINTRESDEQYYAYQTFKKYFGREPTDIELAQATAGYQSGDRNKPNVTGGNAFVAQMYQQQNPYGGAEQNAGAQSDTVNGIFKEQLGRDATDEEKKHFGTLLAAKQYDAYSLGEALKNLPENVRKQDEAFRQSASAELQKGDAQYYNEQIMPGIAQNFAKQGRSFDSSGYAQALAQAAQGQNRQRESFLSNLSASQYEGNKANAYNAYMNNAAYGQNRYDAGQAATAGRVNELNNFVMQKNAYDQYLQRYGKRSNGQGIGQLAGGVIGGGVGAYFGGPAGAGAGYQMGSGIGGGAGSFF